jgi:hypothetical protein
MGRTREDGQSTLFDRNDRLVCRVRCVATPRTVDATSRTVSEEFRAAFTTEATERTELLKMLITPDEWNRQLVQKQEGNALSPR